MTCLNWQTNRLQVGYLYLSQYVIASCFINDMSDMQLNNHGDVYVDVMVKVAGTQGNPFSCNAKTHSTSILT